MTKCKHKTNFMVRETGTWETSHFITNAKEIWHNNEPGSYDGPISFNCEDCGYKRIWTYRKCPKWVKDLLEKIDNKEYTEI